MLKKKVVDDQSSDVNEDNDSSLVVDDSIEEDQRGEPEIENIQQSTQSDNELVEQPSDYEEQKKNAEPILLDMDGTQLDLVATNGDIEQNKVEDQSGDGEQ